MTKLSEKFKIISCARTQEDAQETITDLTQQGFKYFMITAYAEKPRAIVEDSVVSEEFGNVPLKKLIAAMDRMKND